MPDGFNVFNPYGADYPGTPPFIEDPSHPYYRRRRLFGQPPSEEQPSGIGPTTRYPWESRIALLSGEQPGGIGPTRRYPTPEDQPYPGAALEQILPEAQAPQLAQRDEERFPAMRRLEQMEGRPREEQYKPGWKRALLGAGFGALSEWSRPGTGAEITRNVLMAPYQQATEDWEAKMEEAERAAGVESRRFGLESQAQRGEREEAAAGRDVEEFEAKKRGEVKVSETTQMGADGKPHLMQTWRNQFSGEERTVDRGPVTPEPGAQGPRTLVMGNRTYQWDAATGKWNDIGPAAERGPKATPAQKAAIERWKTEQLARAEAGFRERDTRKKTIRTPEELQQVKQQIQDAYEQQMAALGEEGGHFAYPPWQTEFQQAPTAAGGGLPAPGAAARTATMADVTAYAQQAGISQEEAVQLFYQRGYQVTQ